LRFSRSVLCVLHKRLPSFVSTSDQSLRLPRRTCPARSSDADRCTVACEWLLRMLAFNYNINAFRPRFDAGDWARSAERARTHYQMKNLGRLRRTRTPASEPSCRRTLMLISVGWQDTLHQITVMGPASPCALPTICSRRLTLMLISVGWQDTLHQITVMGRHRLARCRPSVRGMERSRMPCFFRCFLNFNSVSLCRAVRGRFLLCIDR